MTGFAQWSNESDSSATIHHMVLYQSITAHTDRRECIVWKTGSPPIDKTDIRLTSFLEQVISAHVVGLVYTSFTPCSPIHQLSARNQSGGR